MNIHYTYKGNKRLAVVTFPFEETKGSHILLENFLRIVEPQSQIIYVITGGYPQESVFPKKITVKNIAHKPGKGPISKSFKYTQTQFLIAFNVLKIVQKVDIVIFYIGGALFPAICIVKLFRKKIVIANTGSGARAAAWIYKGNAGFGKIVSILENLGYLLSDNIVVISESMIPFLGIEKFRHKIISGIGGSPFGGTNAFIDIEQFSIKRDLKDREDIVGYIGRLSAEKGITEFVEAIPQIIKLKNKIRFLIVGEGLLMVDLKKRLEIANCLDKVYFTGVIPHDEIPQILNRMKFLVVPSYTEVVATTALEAMACGTICLATAVGATKDIILEGQTGFILDDNKPSTITEKLLEVWNHPELGKIQLNARKFIEDNFTQLKVTERWGTILDKVME